MTWFKVDDTFHSHPKARTAGPAALGLWVVSGSYASQYATEGFVPDWFIAAWPGGRRSAASLAGVGLWNRGEKGSESGWWFHDWEHYQPSKEEIEHDREMNRERQKRFREKRRAARDDAIGNGANRDSNGVSNAVSNGTPTRPDPTRPLVVLDLVGTSPDVPPEEDHNVKDEQRSKPVSVKAAIVSREYTDRVKLCDRSKVAGVVLAALDAGHEEHAVRKALRGLAGASMAVTPDTLRIELEGAKRPGALNGHGARIHAARNGQPGWEE